MFGLTEIATVTLKELRELFHRPLLVLTMILGPLLILIVFGIGSSTKQRPPRAIVVVPEAQEKPRLVQDFEREFNESLNVVEYTSDEAYARDRLSQDAIDAVLILPASPFETIAGGQPATIRVLYNQIDPLWNGLVPRFARGLAGDINRGIYLQNAGAQRLTLTAAAADLDVLLRALDIAVEAADRGDWTEARRQIDSALDGGDRLADLLGDLGPEAEPLRSQVDHANSQLGKADDSLAASAPVAAPQAGEAEIDRLGLRQVRHNLQALRDAITAFTTVPPEVVIAPLAVQAELIAQLKPDFLTFFAPAILALVVQHVAVSLGSLALVSERLAGSFDLYSIAPISPLSLLLGKYVAYNLFTLVIAGALLGVLLLGMQVPLLGSAWRMALVVLLLAVASVGLGFTLSLLAASERQAVQLSMLSLLGIVFFSGFALPLAALRQPAIGVAYSLPATYGVILLQDIMLRGRAGSDQLVLALSIIAAGLFIACIALLRWRIKAV